MNNSLKIKMYSFTLDCKNPYKLAKFYAELLNWDIAYHTEEWACISPPGTSQGEYPCILFQQNLEYIPPVWPAKTAIQQQMAHIDFAVNNLEKSVEYAIKCGATLANDQFDNTWKVMFDPAGHPFCLCKMNKIFESENFALL